MAMAKDFLPVLLLQIRLAQLVGPYSAIPFLFWTSGPVRGESPDYWDSAELIRTPIPRNGSGKLTTTTTTTTTTDLTNAQTAFNINLTVI